MCRPDDTGGMDSEHTESRRSFLGAALSACATSLAARGLLAAPETPAASQGLGFPLVDLHVHLDNSSIEQALPLSRERGVKFGIVEHAGTRENKYPVVLSNDDELRTYIRKLDGKGVYKGVQAEWTDWARCFSRQVLAQLDYTLTDAMTFPGKDGQRVKLWEQDVEQRVDMANHQVFMDRFVDWHVRTIGTQPIDILANVSWLPAPLAGDYDKLWTESRITKVVDAALKHRVALEISSSFRLPRLKFLKIAKEAGVKFTFGSNGRYPRMGLLEYCVAMAKELGLKRTDIFTPAPDGRKAVQRRTW
jgi:histidinol phosphatase-like PHP family hydrolase